MKKLFKYAFLALTAMTMTFGSAACGDDDKKNDEPNNPVNPIKPGDEYHDASLIGTWEWKGSGGWDRYTFRANGTCRVEGYENTGSYSESWWDEYTWMTQDGYLTMVCTSSSDDDMIGETGTCTYQVSGNRLYLDGDMEEPYIKK